MKIKKLFSVISMSLLFGLAFYMLSCTHDDVVDLAIDPAEVEYGTDKVSPEEGWSFDQNHSSVRWETAYLGSSALLTGRFNDFVIELDFDEDDPENISVVGKVTLSSVNTGEPGRDGGCLLSTFAVETNDEAIFTSKSVSFDGSGGYEVLADLDFHGVTSEVIMKLSYIGSTRFDESSGLHGAPFTVAGFNGEFEFQAKSIFGIESSNISDRVLVRINAQYKKAG